MVREIAFRWGGLIMETVDYLSFSGRNPADADNVYPPPQQPLGGALRSVAQDTKGSGAVMRRGLQKIAAYRDDSGVLHQCSAACPHLDCIVRWNRPESTWDCPCHGSRFDPYGKVINGPANRDLASAERAVDKRAA